MAMRRLVALGGLRYGTRMLRAGEEFEVDGPKARAYIALGRARPADARRLVADKELAADLEAVIPSEPVSAKKAAPRRKKAAAKK